MNDHVHFATAPEDRIPSTLKVVYGLGAFVNNLLAGAIGGMIIVLNLGLGMNPALVGLLGALPRLTDAITDPLMGYLSDNTRTRWGRRRPYIFVGALLAALTFVLLWQLPADRSEDFYFWYFLIGSLIFYLAYTVFATPWVALGYELTPDYHERTRLMGVQNFIGQLAYVVAPWFLWVMQNRNWFDNMVDGAAGLAIVVGVFVACIGVLPAVLLRERFFGADAVTSGANPQRDTVQAGAAATTAAAPVEAPVARPGAVPAAILDFFRGFALTLRFAPFLKLCAATFLVFNGFMLIASFQFYVIIYYVFGGDTDLGAKYAGYSGTLGAVSTFAVIVLVTWLGTRIGKRRAFFLSTGVSMVGYALKWVCYNPEVPWLLLLPAPLMAFGLGGLFTLMPSMIADVVDMDELNTRERREGMFGSIFWWVVKLGMAAALAASGFLLNATGFDVNLEGAQSERTVLLMRMCDAFIPFTTSAIAMWVIATFSITEEKAHEVRRKLEARRGSASPAPLAAAT